MQPVETIRCPWAGNDPLYLDYHDTEWGVPVHDDGKLFEFLILEGAQAGLSWITILRKRENYRTALAGFDPKILTRFGENQIKDLLCNSGIIRNRRKLESIITNSRAFLDVEEKWGSFDRYLWRFVDGKPLQNHWDNIAEVPAFTQVAQALSADLIRHGFKFVGPTICYSLMQAVGMVNDHLIHCFRYEAIRKLSVEN